jgi:hypothetical protein
MVTVFLWLWAMPGLSQPVVAARSAANIEVWLLTASPDDSVVRGARMGAEEVARTAALLGRQFVLHELAVTSSAEADRLAGSIAKSHGARFVLLDLNDDVACAVANAYDAGSSAVVLNARIQSRPCPARWLALRLRQDRRNALLEQSGMDAGTLRIDEWHPSLQRFGAGELNERYERRAHAAMDGDAWAGWFAIKAAAEASLRLDRVDRGAFLAPSAPAFDGHKGVALRFDASGMLEQPVYLIDLREGSAGRVIKEIS